MSTKIKKVLKPIEIDASFKYICPDCGYNFWIYLREVQTKNFKIVCECGTIFKPKRIKKLQIVYSNEELIKKPLDKPEDSDTIREYPEYVFRAINMMVSLGYSKKESHNSIICIYESEKCTDPGTLVKKAISHFGGIK